MGPPKKSVAPPPSTPRRCILCRRDALSGAEQQRINVKLKSCAISLCTIFGLPDNHPFKIIYERAQYCEPCLKEVQEADMTLGKLELMKQTLLRFQNRVYSKLGDNYFQIDNRENLNASFVDFEAGGAAMKGRKFSYDEIVKIIYEKLDRDCLKWERFSSEGKIDTGPISLIPKTTDTSTQTEVVFHVETATLPSQPSTSIIVNDAPQVIIADIVDDVVWDCDDNGAADDEVAGGSEFDVSATTASYTDPLAGIIYDSNVEIDYGPEAAGLPFSKAPINFEEKIYCTFDPENCKRFFYDEYNLKVHIKSFHQGNPLPHQCTVCHKEFVDEGRLKNHFVRLHAKSESFMCDQCGKGFPHPVILREHVRKKHINVKESFACSFCTAPFFSAFDLTTHESLHRSKEVPFSCVFCPDTFPNSTVLKAHYNTCHSDNRFPCPQCGKILASEHSLKVHMNVHTSAFKCDQCEFTGTSNTSLKNHLLTHTTEKLFKCEVCGHAFKYAKNLSGHMRIHTGEKPYSCSLCGQSFRELSYLRRHEESHSSTINYSCETCGAGFKVKENLKKHQRTHKEGYTPKKKAYTPRTEEQKEQRRLKREQLRREGVLSPLKRQRRISPKRKPAKVAKVTKPAPTGTIVIKAEPKPLSKKQRRSSPSQSPTRSKTAKKSVKKSKGRGGGRKKQPKKQEDSSEEEYSEEDDYPMEEPEEEEQEQKVAYTELSVRQTEEEVANAVASISTVDASALYTSNVVFANHFQTTTQPAQATFIPVTVVNTQGVKSASQLVVRARNSQQQPQQHHVMQYQFL